MKTYQFPTYFVTTNEDLSDQNPIAVFEVTEEQAQEIDNGAILAVESEELFINPEPQE